MDNSISKASGAYIADRTAHTVIALVRRVLFILMIASVSISAVIAIVSILTAGFNEDTGKAIGTSLLISGVSFLMILQTSNIQKLKATDYLVSIFGILSSLFVFTYAMDMIYSWNFVSSIITDDMLRDKIFFTVAMSSVALAVIGLLTSAFINKVTKVFALFTIALVISDAVFISWNIWNDWNLMLDENWSKFWAILNILLGVGFIVTLILNLVGKNKVKSGVPSVPLVPSVPVEPTPVAPVAPLAPLAPSDAEELLKPATLKLLKKEAQFRELSPDELVKKLLKDNPAHRPFI